MAIAECGAIIVNEKSNRISYKKKCEKCSHIQPGQTNTSKPNSHSKITSSFSCIKCRNRQKIIISG